MKTLMDFPKLIIFDLDGVIVDTAKYHFIAWKKLAKSFDFDLTKERNEDLKGVGRMESLDMILDWAGEKRSKLEKKRMAAQKNVWYIKSLDKLSPKDMLPGVKAFIDETKEKGIKIAIGSSSKNAKVILEKLGITGLFDIIIDGTMIHNTKPNPEVFLLGTSKTGIAPKDTIVFEDANSGIEAAKAAGMMAVGVGDLEVLKSANLVIPGFKKINLSKFLKMIKK